MLLKAIQSELVRVQIHPVNLDVTTQDGQLVALGGSLLRYWTLPKVVDAQGLLDVLRAQPDAAGATIVMTALCAANASALQSLMPLDPASSG
jgi:hypothetical protein